MRTFRHRAGVQVVTMGGSRCWERLRLAEGSRRIVVLSGHGQDERAAWLAVAGWPGAWSDAGRWRCPPLGRHSPDRVRTHRLGGHLELGMSGRPDGREVRQVRRPASHCWVSQEQLVGGDGVQAGVRRPHPGGSGRPAGLRACPARHGRGPRGAHEAIEDWVRGPTSGSGAETYFPPSIGRRTIVGGGVGQWVSVSGSRVSALAAGGSARRRVVPRGGRIARHVLQR